MVQSIRWIYGAVLGDWLTRQVEGQHVAMVQPVGGGGWVVASRSVPMNYVRRHAQ